MKPLRLKNALHKKSISHDLLLSIFVFSFFLISNAIFAQQPRGRFDVYTGTVRVGNKGTELEIEKLETSFRTNDFRDRFTKVKNTTLDDVKLKNENSLPISVFDPEFGAAKIRSKTAGVLDFNAIQNSGLPNARTDDFNQKVLKWDSSLQDYDKAFVGVLKNPKPQKIDLERVLVLNKQLQNNIANCFVALAKESLAAPGNPKLQEALAAIDNSWASSSDERRSVIQINKATYGDRKHRDVYPASQYETIFSSSRSIGKVQSIGDKSDWGSCVFVGNGFFLTAGHVLNDKPPTLFEVTFSTGILQKPNISSPFKVVIDFRNQTNALAERMDLLLCRLKTSTNEFDSFVTAAHPKRDLVLDLGTPCLESGTPVYVIGFPDIADVGKAIHDNCAVVIQRLVPSSEIGKHCARLTLSDRLQVCEQRVAERSLALRIRDLADLFKALYGYGVGDQAVKPGGYIARFEGMEIMGIDSDTSGGDSGGGVFDKQSGDLVGIFLGGIPDNQNAEKADSQKFERVLPVEVFWGTVKIELEKK